MRRGTVRKGNSLECHNVSSCDEGKLFFYFFFFFLFSGFEWLKQVAAVKIRRLVLLFIAFERERRNAERWTMTLGIVSYTLRATRSLCREGDSNARRHNFFFSCFFLLARALVIAVTDLYGATVTELWWASPSPWWESRRRWWSVSTLSVAGILSKLSSRWALASVSSSLPSSSKKLSGKLIFFFPTLYSNQIIVF